MSGPQSPRSSRVKRALAWVRENPDACVAIALTVLYLVAQLASPYPSIDGDGHYNWLWARSLVLDHDLDLDNDVQLCGDPWHRGLGPSGHARNEWPLGPALVWAPLLQLARWLLPGGAGAMGAACRGPWAEFAMLGSALAGAAALWLALRMGRRHGVSRGATALGILTVAFCSMLPYYAIVLPSYSHAGAALAAALFVERWDRFRDRPTVRRGLLLGALLGFAMLMRTQSAILALLPLCDALRDLGRAGRRWLLPAAAFGLTALIVESPYRFALHHMYGSAFAIPQGSWFLRWGHSNPVGLLFSSYNGLLTTTPLLYPAVIALLALPLWPRHRRHWPLAALFLVALYVNGAAWDWWGEASFSARRLTDFACIFAFTTALAAEAALRFAERWPRRAAGLTMAAALALFALWNGGAMVAEATGRTRQFGARPAPERWTPVMDLTGRLLWHRMGNPLAWPASLPFALWHGVHPRAFDRLVGPGFFFRRYHDRQIEPGTEIFDFSGADEYFAEGFSSALPVTKGGGRRLKRSGRALIPLFDDAVAGVEVDAVAPVDCKLRVRWNGAQLAELALTPDSPSARVELPPGTARVGVNELVLEASAPVQLRWLRFLERR